MGRPRTYHRASVPVGQIEQHKQNMARRGWTFESQEALDNGCETHVWLHYRKPDYNEESLYIAYRKGEQGFIGD